LINKLIKGIGVVSIFLSSLITPLAWGICVADLQKQVEVIVQSPRLRSARVGVFASKLDTLNQPIVNIDSNKYFTPASNVKLFTTAAALEILGASYQIKTSLLIDQTGENLWIKAGGDPSFNENSLKSLVQALVQSLKARGIKAIASNIKALPELKGSGLGKGWQWEDLQEYYAAIAHSFIFDENVLDWTITPTKINQPVKFSWNRPDIAPDWIIENQATTVNSALTNSLKVERSLAQKRILITGQLPLNSEPELGATAIPDPEAHFLQLLRREIIKQGISFKPEVLNISNSSISAIKVATFLSPTLTELIKVTNKQSHNLYAEALLRRVGVSFDIANPSGQKDSSDLGIEAITKFLAIKGISEVVMQDGSGLSTLNLATPRAIAQLLTLMANNPVFRNSLAIANQDGTLKNRFKTQNINMQGKTGTLTSVSALSGYIQPPKYPEIAFSIIINNSNLSSSELTKEIDAIALLLNASEECN